VRGGEWRKREGPDPQKIYFGLEPPLAHREAVRSAAIRPSVCHMPVAQNGAFTAMVTIEH